jgi:hypothetical protein
MSESFYLSIVGFGSACLTGICLAGCKNIYRIKCINFSCFGLICSRDIAAENTADTMNVNGLDTIPQPTIPNSRRNSSIN